MLGIVKIVITSNSNYYGFTPGDAGVVIPGRFPPLLPVVCEKIRETILYFQLKRL